MSRRIISVRPTKDISLLRLAVCLLFLGACQGPLPPLPLAAFPDPTYDHLGQIQFDVAAVDIVEAYRPTYAAPNVDHLFPVPLITAARAWARDRLRAAGGANSGRAIFNVREASVVAIALPTTGGVRGAVTVNQSVRYEAELTVELEILGPGGGQRGRVFVTAKRSRTAPEDITLDGRDRLWFAMTETLIADMNRELEARIRAILGSFLR